MAPALVAGRERLLFGQISDPYGSIDSARRPPRGGRAVWKLGGSGGRRGVDVRGVVVVAGRPQGRVHGLQRRYEGRVRRGSPRTGPEALGALRLRSPMVARRRRDRRRQAVRAEHGSPRHGSCARRDGAPDRERKRREVCVEPQREPACSLSRLRACRGGRPGRSASADGLAPAGWASAMRPGPPCRPRSRPLVVVGRRPDVRVPGDAVATPRARRGACRLRPGRPRRRGPRARSRRRARRPASPSSSPRGRAASAGARPCRRAMRAP